MSTRFSPLPLESPAVVGVRLSGAAGRDARPLLERLGDRCLEKRRLRLVLDLQGLSGLGNGTAAALADLQRRLVAAGGEMVFVAPNGGVRHFLESCFTSLPLRCFRTAEEALAGLLASPAAGPPEGGAGGRPADGSARRPARRRARRFLTLDEALPLLRAATDAADFGEALEDLLRAHDLGSGAACWLRQGDELLGAEAPPLSADGGLARALLAAGRPLTLLDAAEADLEPAEAELLTERQPDLILPVVRGGRLEAVVLLKRGDEASEYGLSESFALELLPRVLAAATSPEATSEANPGAALAAVPEAAPGAAPWGEELALNLARLLHAARPGGLDWATRTADLVAATARALELPERLGREMAAGALLCDLALLGRPELNLAGRRLDARQWEFYRAHGETGADMLAAMGAPAELTDLVRHHHERFNGEGYPGALAGDDIPLGARVVAAVDTWLAMTTEMPSRPALPLEQALQIMTENVGQRHDPQVVAALLRVLSVSEAPLPA